MLLYHRESGQGAPLVLLHGLFGSLENLSGLARVLGANHTVYSVDLPDHGRSPHTERSDLAAMVDGVRRWMDAQQLSRAILVGHSLGGKVAMELALQNPDRVTGLVVMDVAPVAYDSRHDNVFQGLLSVPVEEIQSRARADEALKVSIADAAVRGFLLKNLVKEGEGFRWRMNLQGLHRGYRQLIAGNSAGNFATSLDPRGGELGDHAARGNTRQRFPRHRLDLLRQPFHDRKMGRSRIQLRIGGVESVDVGEQDQRVRVHHRGHPRCQSIIVAHPDLRGGHGVILVDHRQCPVLQQGVERVAGIEVTPPRLGILEREQHLRHGDAVARESRLIGVCQADLTGRCGCLLLLELETLLRQVELPPAHGDGT